METYRKGDWFIDWFIEGQDAGRQLELGGTCGHGFGKHLCWLMKVVVSWYCDFVLAAAARASGRIRP